MKRTGFIAPVACVSLCGALLLNSCSTCGDPASQLPVIKGAATPAAPGLATTNAEAAGLLSLSLGEAVLMALERNESFCIERLGPAARQLEELAQGAAFEPVLSGSVEAGRSRSTVSTGDVGLAETIDADSVAAELSVAGFLSTGTTLELAGGAGKASSAAGSQSYSDQLNWEATLTQSLLRGRGTAANLARLRQARLDTQMSVHEFRAAAETLVAQVERAYWDHVLAGRAMEIHEQSVQIATREVEEVRERIKVGNVAETELAAAEAELASRQEQLITARGDLAKRRLNFVRLLNPGGEAAWERELALRDAPELPALALGGVDGHVRTSLERRADLAQARLQIERGGLEVVRTRNGLLPRLDLFVKLGGSSYASSLSDAGDENGDGIEYGGGISFEMPLGNRDARAQHGLAVLSVERAQAALRNMEQLAQVDVRSAYVEVVRAEERVKATQATRELREKTWRNEQEKFLVGRSTTFLVSQAGRDAVASRIAEVESVIGYRKALLDLARLDGSLLSRWGLEVQ